MLAGILVFGQEAEVPEDRPARQRPKSNLLKFR